MAATSLDLFRAGNSTSARMQNVRPKDVVIFQRNGVAWVLGRSGGISTFDSKASSPGYWWCLPAGSPYDARLLVVWNDHGNHWSWEPAFDMPLDEYKAALAAVDANFIRI
jgi:hypothetical protein